MRQNKQTSALMFFKLSIGMIISCCLLFAGATGVAAENGDKNGNTADIIVVLDMSGSMKTADDNGRFDSFFSWVSAFASSRDQLGIVAMGNGSKLIAPLTGNDRFAFADYSDKLNKRAKYTDVAAGLENAYYELKNNARKNSQKIILLYSDAQIDMPKGMWDMENSLRYLNTSLIPSMRKEGIQLIAIVPDGLKANFQLLQELTSATNGVYYRGLPDDAVATRQLQLHSAAAVEQDRPQSKKSASSRSDKSIGSPVTTKPSAPPVAGVDTRSKKADAPAPTRATASETSADGGIGIQFLLFGFILLLGFGVLFTAIAVLFKRTAGHKAESSDELVDMLHELQSIKTVTERSEIRAEALETDLDEDGEPDFGEPKERLSVSLISPFLDYEEAKGTIRRPPTDEIAIRPAFSDEHTDDLSLSVSNMETLIGTGLPEVEDK